jgi:hypothetical protein
MTAADSDQKSKARRDKVFTDFLRRELGEELARVSQLPLEERWRYLAWMIDNARKHGVKFEKPALGVTP